MNDVNCKAHWRLQVYSKILKKKELINVGLPLCGTTPLRKVVVLTSHWDKKCITDRESGVCQIVFLWRIMEV